MLESQNPLLKDLQARQLIAQTTAVEELDAHLSEQPRVLYCGFDPTADSLHLGHLVPLAGTEAFSAVWSQAYCVGRWCYRFDR